MAKCTLCQLHRTCQANCIPMDGSKDAEVLFVGEAPGADEDQEGLNFSGRSGKLLRTSVSNKLKSIKVAYCNTVRCRPPNNRDPEIKEIAACKPYLMQDIESLKNLKLVVAVGNFALYALHGRKGITKQSGKIVGDLLGYPNIRLFALLHPAYVLRNQPISKMFLEHVGRINTLLKGDLIDDTMWKNKLICTAAQFEDELRHVRSAGYIVYDTETNGLSPYRRTSALKCISFSYKMGEVSTIPISTIQSEGSNWDRKAMDAFLHVLFTSKRIGKVGHNIKFDNAWMSQHIRSQVHGTIWDTAISQFLLNEIEGVSLKELAWKYTKWGGYEKKLPDLPHLLEPCQALYDYCATDVAVSHILYHNQKEHLPKDKGLHNVFHQLLLPVSEVLLDMEKKGIRLDESKLRNTQVTAATYSGTLVGSLRALPSVIELENQASVVFNPNSHVQLRKLLFDIEKLPVIKLTDKTKAPSTDKEVLEELSSSSQACQLLGEYNRLQSTSKFVDKLLEEVAQGRIHTTYSLTIARTGRTSSENPNMQNMPKNDKDPMGIRECFLPDDGFDLVEADYNQHELRVLAEVSGDMNLLKALQGDVHIATAAAILGKPPSSITEEERRTVGKTFNFGLVYGMTAYGLMKRLGCSEGEAKNFLMRFFGEYSQVERWMKEVENYVRANSFIRTLSGRVRRFPSWDKLEDSNIREAINTPIQGTASDILLYSLIGISKFFKQNNLRSFITLQVHDSIVFNIHKEEHNCLPYIKKIMLTYFKNYMPFKTDLNVDFKIGPNWGKMEEIVI